MDVKKKIKEFLDLLWHSDSALVTEAMTGKCDGRIHRLYSNRTSLPAKYILKEIGDGFAIYEQGRQLPFCQIMGEDLVSLGRKVK
ncbi:unnamed protein product [marine sediment metagenome]|uniref:Uncharacterized protein n=1 Tax=marine sediment metagenome TaxID=412755 RepID=X0TG87_9ZZZZ